MKLLMAASEVVGFAKTGGLADVAGSLPRELSRRGCECAIVMPLYRSVRNGAVPIRPTEHRISIPIGGRTVAGRFWQAALPNSNVPIYLVEQPDFYERDDPTQGRSFYQWTSPNGGKQDYADNCSRFIFFCRAVLEAMPLLDYWPDVLHVHDWQTGLAPVYLREMYGRLRYPEHQKHYHSIRTLFTVHNIAYQGVFWHFDMPLTGLDWRLFNFQQLEFHGKLNFLKAGMVFADAITTVSPTYAKEIQTPYFGAGLQGVLTERRDRLFGIVNGIDYEVWNPATDPHLAARYTIDNVSEGKSKCKAALQRRFHLPLRRDVPVLGMVARLVEQKGLDLIARAADAMMQMDVQFIVLGEGDPRYQEILQELAGRFPDRVGLHVGFDEALAHQIEAGVDLYLMPSLFEPSGLNQLYSMRYGTPPVVRATGGLADTVVDCTPAALAAGSATGFRFIPYSSEAMLEAIQRAVNLYRNQPDDWLRLVRTGMLQDWSWQRSAAEYEKLYAHLIRGR